MHDHWVEVAYETIVLLSPDLTHAKTVIQDLKDNDIEDKHIYTIAKTGTSLEGLPDGGPDDNDFLPVFERGIAMGGAAGIFLGLVALSFPPAGIVVVGGAVLIASLMGASVGGLLLAESRHKLNR